VEEYTRTMMLARPLPMLRLLVVSLTLAGASCAGLGGGDAPKTQKRARGPDDEEAGVKRISGLMRDFGRALESKDFDGAGAKLRDAETAVKTASEVTKSHPDFDEIAERVQKARPRLDAAIERDRIERRNAAIAALVKKGEQLMQRGNVLMTELAKRVPEREDMTNLKELIEELTAISQGGTQYLDDWGYKQHAEVRDRLAHVIIGRKRQADWQIQTSAAVGRTVDQAFTAVEDAKKSTNPTEQLVSLRKAAESFVLCVTAIADAESLGGYDTGTVLTTRIGTVPVADTKKRCIELGGKVRTQADRLAFQERGRAVARRVDDAMKAVAGAAAADAKVKAVESALEALSYCQADLESAQRGPGYDTTFAFDTALGPQLNADKLRKACTSERTKLAQSLPQLRWRRGFETMKPGLVTIKQRVTEATAIADVGAQIPYWQRVLENLSSCVERSRALAGERDADGKYAFVTAFGELTVSGVEKECERQRVVAEAKLARAVENQSIETFASTCKGDEPAVVRREGVPTQVVPVEGGRLFVYGKGPGTKSFGFDAEGKAVDFAVKWREQVDGVVTEIARVTKDMKAAESGATLLAATTAAMPVLDVCIEGLTGTEKHPGYDGKARFGTDLGKLTAIELRAACLKRRAELASTMPMLKWRAQLEQVRDRAVDAYMQVEEARSNADIDKRVQKSGAALGGYRECVERAESMARAPDADKKATVNGPFGPVTALGLAKACRAEITSAEAALKAALDAAKLEQFLASCKADEVEVTRREGMPTRIESLGTGRIFVYEGKAKQKARRFAFDANGARVEEAALKRP